VTTTSGSRSPSSSARGRSVREFKIQTNLYSADIAATREPWSTSSRNPEPTVHGSLSNSCATRPWIAEFLQPQRHRVPSFPSDQFGGSSAVRFGAQDTRKGSTFFFVDYEGYRHASQSLASATSPHCLCVGRLQRKPPRSRSPHHDSERQRFVRTQFPGYIIPAKPASIRDTILINAYPTPTSSGRFNNYTSNVVQKQKLESG